jgi:hypothetical protein
MAMKYSSLNLSAFLCELKDPSTSKDFKADFCQELGELLDLAVDYEGYAPLYHYLPDHTCKPKGRSKGSTCMICHGKFASYKGMMLHRSKTHDKQAKRSPCSLCSKRFTSKYALQFHVKQVHLKATRMKCDFFAATECSTTNTHIEDT